MSISTRLLTILLACLLGVLLVSGLSLYHVIQQEAADIFDARLVHSARSLMFQVNMEHAEGEHEEIKLILENARKSEASWLQLFSMEQGESQPAAGEVRTASNDSVFVWLAAADGKILAGQPLPIPKQWQEQQPDLQSVSYAERNWQLASAQNDSASLQLFIAQRDDLLLYVRWQIIWDFVQQYLLFLPLLIALSWVAVHKGLSPLHGLSQQISRRRADSLKPIPEWNNPAEIKPVIKSVNSLLQRLESALENEKRITANVAHELRTPLASISNTAKIITDADSLEQARQSSYILEQSVQRIAELFYQLLLLSRLDSSQFVLVEENADLVELLGEAIENNMGAANEKGMDVDYQGPDQVNIKGNRVLLVQLFGNLLSNAIKYSPKFSVVSLQITLDEDLLLRVSDTGPGIPEAEAARIFRRFYRAETSPRESVGAGLGLSIVKRIADIHGIQVQAGNNQKGGLTVSVLIPSARVNAAP